MRIIKLHSKSANQEFLDYTKKDKPQTESYQISKFILSNVKFNNEGNLLEIGAGKGILLSKFRKKLPKWKLHAIEPSKNAVNFF